MNTLTQLFNPNHTRLYIMHATNNTTVNDKVNKPVDTKNTEPIEEKTIDDLQKLLTLTQTHNLRLGKIQKNLEKDQTRFLNKIMSLISTYEELQDDEQMVKEYTIEEMIEQTKKYCDLDFDKINEDADDDTKKNIQDYKSLVLDIQ